MAGDPPAAVVQPTVHDKPTTVQFAQNYPPKAWDEKTPGSATLGCTVLFSGELSNCAVISEQPAGAGFGDAALKLAPLYSFNPRTNVDGFPINSRIRFTIAFPVIEHPGAPLSDAAPVDHPWLTCPDTDAPQAASYYPERAQRSNKDGKADVECRLNVANGHMTACAWVSQTPPNYHFGEAAEKLACMIRLEAAAPPQAATEERLFKKTIVFHMPTK